MPPIGVLLGKVDFADKKYIITQADPLNKVTEVAIRYGNFITVVFQFVIVAFCIFLVVKAINSMKKKEEAAPAPAPEPTKEEILLTEIRDLLAKKA